MKYFTIILLMFMCLPAWAKKTQLFEVKYSDRNSQHTYVLVEDTDKDSFILKSIQNKKTTFKKLSRQQSKALQNYVSSVAWDSQYRKPSSVQKCTEYAQIKSTSAKARICHEDKLNTGKTLGLLGELHRLVYQ